MIQDRQDDARQTLLPVYERFTEGFETADLRAAREMLEAL
jgi:predicted ATPase